MWVMRNTMDRLFDSLATGQPSAWQSVNWELPLDLVESEDEYVVKASLPGINPDDLDVTFTENTLSIKAEVKSEEDREGERYHIRERRYGTYSRSLSLPRGVRAEGIEASYEAGVLTLRLPKREEIKPKRIAVHSVEAPQMIEGKVTDIKHKN
jgi:HSP20 family protein